MYLVDFSDSSELKMPKAKKVSTPGSYPGISSRGGRPAKVKKREVRGSSRKGNYRTKYTEAMLEEAMEAVTAHRMSLREAAKEYGVPKTTMIDRLSGRRGAKLGRSTELSADEEELIVERILVLGKWGFPLGKKDLTHLIKGYLDRLGKSTREVSENK
jgi:hypothetical protein